MIPRLIAPLLAAIVAAGCDQPKKPRERAAPTAQARLDATIPLPGGQGTAHVLVVPTGYMESARCVIVTSPAGSTAVACTPKDFDFPPDDAR